MQLRLNFTFNLALSITLIIFYLLWYVSYPYILQSTCQIWCWISNEQESANGPDWHPLLKYDLFLKMLCPLWDLKYNRRVHEEMSLSTKANTVQPVCFVIRVENKLSSVKWQQVALAAALNTTAVSPSLQIKARGGWLLGAVCAGVLWWSWVDRKLQNESRHLCPSGGSLSQRRTQWTGCIKLRLADSAPAGVWSQPRLIQFLETTPSPNNLLTL